MESFTENAVNTDEYLKLKACGTAEDLQVFITNLFERNGVLNDLRAYLRSHIVTFLRSVENGDIPEYQKCFTQRLQMKYQAINTVIAEYLMKLKFGYSFSVFISEIPLPNMVFDFTKKIFEDSLDGKNIHFSAKDIVQILNYLGILCDHECSFKILEDYQNHDEPLLMCILKNSSLHGTPVSNVEDDLNTESHNNMNNQVKCKHYMSCRLCKNYLFQVKEKYKKRKKHMAEFQNGLRSSFNTDNVVTKVKVIERSLIEEMFEQLKNVFEGEIEILREGDKKKVKHSLANHASLMQKHRLELEKEMENRRVAMEAELRERKEFVAGLAATLKEAHEKLREARQKLKKDADDLINKENSLKSQLQIAEEMLKVKGEEMQKQISRELKLLDEQHQNLKSEKLAIDNERQELENIKKLNETNFKLLSAYNIQERDNLVKQYDAMKNELDILKKYVALSYERPNQDALLRVNNKEATHDNDEKAKVNNIVVNDLKKMNNVNFSQTVSTMCHKCCQDAVTGSSKCDGSCLDTLKRLKEEHEKLQEFSKQQSSHIELLSLSLREIHQATRTRETAHSVSKQIFVNEKIRENVCNDDLTLVTHKSLYLGNTSTKENRDTSNSKQRTPNNTEIQNVTLKEGSSKTLKEIRDLLKKKHMELLAIRDSSSNKMIREAKLRLRKLEIEAEAVEKSYLKFRQRRAQENRELLKDANEETLKIDTTDRVKNKPSRENKRNPDADEMHNKRSYKKIEEQINLDFDKYLLKYHDIDKSAVTYNKLFRIDRLKSHFNNEDEVPNGEWHTFNYLETPLMEFRKLYQSSTHRTTSRSLRETQKKKVFEKIQNNKLGVQSIDTNDQSKGCETHNRNTLDNNPNTTPQIKITDNKDTNRQKMLKNMKNTEIDEPFNNFTEIENIVKTCNDNLYEIAKEDSMVITTASTNDNDPKIFPVKVDDKTEPLVDIKKSYISEMTKHVLEIDKESIKNYNVYDDNESGEKIDDLAEKHKNGKNIKETSNKETIKELTNMSLEENESHILKDLSDLKTNASDHDFSEKSFVSIHKHSVTGKFDDANPLTKVDDHSIITFEEITGANDNTHENEIDNKPDSLKDNSHTNNTEEDKPVSPKETVNNTEEQIEEASEIENHSEPNYEDDFSIPIIENSLSETNNSPISVLKSTEEENFWD